jgi:hypothetical protein
MSPTRLASPTLGALAALLAAAAIAQAPELPGSTYASIAELPDFSGWWATSTALAPALRASPPPLKPEVAARARAANPDADPLRYCRPPVFTGSSGGFTEAIELLFTPGRVTLTNERGLVRRIYTGGQTAPPDLDATNTGLSTGRWEGETLVVETALINPSALLPSGSIGAGVPIGENARITERISLANPDTLVFDIEVVAPDILTAPYRRTQRYERLPKTIASEITFCSDYDRSVDQTTGAQRFDMTPPAGLAPPPPR